MTIKFLEWDSIFFVKKIAAAYITISDNEEDIISQIKSYPDYELVYIHTPQEYVFSKEIVSRENLLLMDSKVIYAKEISNIDGIKEIDRHISVYSKKEIHPSLLSLALLSGECSRYKLDENFAKQNAFERLYEKWIENSINGSFADVTYVYEESGSMEGMVTVSIDRDNGVSKIGLISVNKKTQNKGIGTKLMDAVINYSIQNSVTRLEVATQLRNTQACAFYDKRHLSVKSITNIYHYWIKKGNNLYN